MVMSHAKLGCISMATKLLLLAIILATVELPVTQAIGVCYGRNGDNLPSQQEVVALYKSNNIPRMRIYDPDQGTLEALRNSDIEVILGVPNSELGSIANDANAANSWVQKNVQNFWPSVKFRYIAVGNEVSPTNGESANVPFVLPAMRNIHSALSSAGLQNQIKVSTATYNGLVNPSFPPRDGAFDGAAQSFMSQIVGYLGSIGSPILVNVYPYFSFTGMAADKLSYALFTKTDVEFVDRVTGLSYRNLFDAIVDATYAALEKAGGPNLEIVISESGWPSAGGTGASVDNAKTYNQNLINHVKNGTPKKPGKAIETYIFAMFNENQKPGDPVEKNFGLFLPNKQPAYPINFS